MSDPVKSGPPVAGEVKATYTRFEVYAWVGVGAGTRERHRRARGVREAAGRGLEVDRQRRDAAGAQVADLEPAVHRQLARDVAERERAAPVGGAHGHRRDGRAGVRPQVDRDGRRRARDREHPGPDPGRRDRAERDVDRLLGTRCEGPDRDRRGRRTRSRSRRR